ncbi:MAG: hypothetical protein JO040_13430, partial [Gemmatimonadetes bacterium]|nr:hypothetical protein [Gemmatimonadota bacterium]
MNTLDSPAAADTRSTVEALTQQRDQLRGWLARLDEVGNGVPGHVAERVRADYRERLRAATQELSSHQETIRGDLDTQRAELEQAEAMRTEAADELEEVRLRHLIGELGEETWTARRPHLESAVTAADEEATRIRAEVERLDTLLREMGQAEAAPTAEEAAPEPRAEAEAPPAEAAGEAPRPRLDSYGEDTVPEYTPPTAGGAAEEDGFDLSWLDEVEGSAAPQDALPVADADATSEAGAEAVQGTLEDDMAFLEELDRAIAATPDDRKPAVPAADPDRTLDA